MKIPGMRSKSGFSLIEVVIASSVLVIVLSISMVGLLRVLSDFNEQMVQAELDVDVQKSMESLKYDIRLSSLDEMFFYPEGPGPYTAISMPIARDNDGDGALDTDPNTGKLIWYKQLIYHVWSGQPTELRLTTFDPRPALTDAQLQEQLNSVVTTGTGSNTYGANSASTKVVFANLFDWSVTPRGSRFDGYSSTTGRMENVYLGSCVLSGGVHSVEFEVIGASGSGRRIGVDSFVFSPSGSKREGEGQTVTASSGATPVSQYIAGGGWDGNHHLYFPATANGNSFTLAVENDRWEETNFSDAGDIRERTQVLFDESLNPKDFVIQLNGMTTNWYAALQTGDTNGAFADGAELKGSLARVLIKGDQMPMGGWITSAGQKCQVKFRSGNGQLRILNAYIAECADAASNTVDITGTSCPLLFSGSASCTIAALSSVTSDLASFTIDRARSYAVTFYASKATGQANAWKWDSALSSIPTANVYFTDVVGVETPTAVMTANWSARSNLETNTAIFAIEDMYVTYATNGYYTSSIFDTHVSAPSYSQIGWNSSVPWGTDCSIKVRSGSQPNMSDAPDWTSVTAMSSPGSLSIGNGQYVQFQACLTSSTGGLLTPQLKNVTIRWPGPQQVVDFVGAFTTGPSYGIFEITVDGNSLVMGLSVDLEIYEDIRSMRQTKRIVSSLVSEIRPRNTGK